MNIENNIGYVFKNKKLFERALTLSSASQEFNNESLECLGDALLTFIVAEKFYDEGCSEEVITKKKQDVVSDEALRELSCRLGLDKVLVKDKGDTNNAKAIPSAYEALIGAIYKDGGFEEAKRVALATLDFKREEINYISALQEFLQRNKMPPPEYVKTEFGTPQKPMFKASVTVYDKEFSGEANSYKEARKIAARSAYESIINSEFIINDDDPYSW